MGRARRSDTCMLKKNETLTLTKLNVSTFLFKCIKFAESNDFKFSSVDPKFMAFNEFNTFKCNYSTY